MCPVSSNNPVVLPVSVRVWLAFAPFFLVLTVLLVALAPDTYTNKFANVPDFLCLTFVLASVVVAIPTCNGMKVVVLASANVIAPADSFVTPSLGVFDSNNNDIIPTVIVPDAAPGMVEIFILSPATTVSVWVLSSNVPVALAPTDSVLLPLPAFFLKFIVDVALILFAVSLTHKPENVPAVLVMIC